MSDLQIFRQRGYREGRWRNGLGTSWDIVSDRDGADFDWRLALARIDGDVPFSDYPGIDRVFTLIEGEGLDLEVASVGRLAVHERFEPQFFPGDAATACRVLGGPCRALNLFVRRDRFAVTVIVTELGEHVTAGHDGITLLYALSGEVQVGGETLAQGDAALLTAPALVSSQAGALLYEARLAPGPR